RVLFFSVLASIFTGVLFGIVPAVKAGRSQLHESLKQGGRGSFRSRHRLQGVLVVTEVALTLMLLAGGGGVGGRVGTLLNSATPVSTPGAGVAVARLSPP